MLCLHSIVWLTTYAATPKQNKGAEEKRPNENRKKDKGEKQGDDDDDDDYAHTHSQTFCADDMNCFPNTEATNEADNTES